MAVGQIDGVVRDLLFQLGLTDAAGNQVVSVGVLEIVAAGGETWTIEPVNSDNTLGLQRVGGTGSFESLTAAATATWGVLQLTANDAGPAFAARQSTAVGAGGFGWVDGPVNDGAGGQVVVAKIVGGVVALTNTVAADVLDFTLANDEFVGAVFTYTVSATDGGDHQLVSGQAVVNLINDGGTIQGTVTKGTEVTDVTAGTLTVALALDVSASPASVELTATSSLTPTAMRARVIANNHTPLRGQVP